MRIEPGTFCLWSRRDIYYTTEPYNAGRKFWTIISLLPPLLHGNIFIKYRLHFTYSRIFFNQLFLMVSEEKICGNQKYVV